MFVFFQITKLSMSVATMLACIWAKMNSSLPISRKTLEGWVNVYLKWHFVAIWVFCDCRSCTRLFSWPRIYFWEAFKYSDSSPLNSTAKNMNCNFPLFKTGIANPIFLFVFSEFRIVLTWSIIIANVPFLYPLKTSENHQPLAGYVLKTIATSSDFHSF